MPALSPKKDPYRGGDPRVPCECRHGVDLAVAGFTERDLAVFTVPVDPSGAAGLAGLVLAPRGVPVPAANGLKRTRRRLRPCRVERATGALVVGGKAGFRAWHP